MIHWLAFTPAYTSPRGNQTQRLGAHAFRANAPKSLCGYVRRERAGADAASEARHCTWCIRVELGLSADWSWT